MNAIAVWPLAGAECASCGYPALRMVILPDRREIHHGENNRARRCVLPNQQTPAPTWITLPAVEAGAE